MYVGEDLNLHALRKAALGQTWSPTGSWEIRLTGMTQGACGNVVMMGAGLRPSGKLMELPPDP